MIIKTKFVSDSNLKKILPFIKATTYSIILNILTSAYMFDYFNAWIHNVYLENWKGIALQINELINSIKTIF